MMIEDSAMRRMMLRQVLRPAAVLLLVCALAGAAMAEVTVTPAEKGYDIDITDQASSGELVDAIVSATGAAVKGQPQDATLATNHLKGISLERALRMLLPHAAFAIRSNDQGTPTAIIFLSLEDGGASAVSGDDSMPEDSLDVPTPADGGGSDEVQQ